MTPKQALIYVGIFALITFSAFGIFIVLKLNSIPQEDQAQAPIKNRPPAEDLIKKQKSETSLTQEEKITLNRFLDRKLAEERRQLEAKINTAPTSTVYSQNEIDFIANPQKTIENMTGAKYQKIDPATSTPANP